MFCKQSADLVLCCYYRATSPTASRHYIGCPEPLVKYFQWWWMFTGYLFPQPGVYFIEWIALLSYWYIISNAWEKLQILSFQLTMQIYYIFNMTGVQQTQIVFNNISIISSKFFFLALHICQRQSLSKFFLKIHRVSKVRFMRFYYLKTDFIRILLIKPHKSNFWYPMYFELKLR